MTGQVPSDKRSVAQRVAATERAWIRQRRAAVNGAKSSRAHAIGPWIGLALSGGGIRSATFSLGVLQALSRLGCLKGIDYLSTVSGGSYIGAFFGSLYIDRDERADPGATARVAFGPPKPEVFRAREAFIADPLGSPNGRLAVARLREFGRYLTPGGMSDTIFGASLVARNWLTIQVVLGMLPLLLFLLLRMVVALWRGQSDAALVRSGSEILLLALGVSLLMSAGLSMAYWLSRKEQAIEKRSARIATPFFAGFALLTIGGWVATGYAGALAPYSVLLVVATIAMLSYVVILVRHGETIAKPDASDLARQSAARQAEERVRSRLTRATATANTWAATFAVLLIVNLLGELILTTLRDAGPSWASSVAATECRNLWAGIWLFLLHFWPLMVVIAPIVLTLWGDRALRRGTGVGILSRPSGQTLLGFAILFLWLATWAAVAAVWTAYATGGLRPDASQIAIGCNLPGAAGGLLAPPAYVPPRTWFGLPMLLTAAPFALAIVIVVQSFMYGFINLSSLVTLYAARLKRAYIGASNPAPDAGGYDIDRAGDLVPMATYYGARSSTNEPLDPTRLIHARPLHLINVTVAQTEAAGASHVVAYDRKGKPLHVSPAGVVCCDEHGAMIDLKAWDEAEDLSLAEWTAISGAAASTAVGSMSSLGLSVLAMMTNVRLGYWWKADRNGKLRGIGDTVLGYLYSELTMRFDASSSTRRRWYLSDGGHFENTGAYPLLQRELEFILVCDNGADPDYRCDDVVRLVQRARIDLGASIHFLSGTQLDKLFGEGEIRPAFGTYAQLASAPKAEGGPYAALARVTYGSGREGWLLLIKPRLSLDEPPELLAYRNRSGGALFPQQTTLDQFFDEEQWEAYRHFGEVVGSRLFGRRPPNELLTGWCPGDLLRGDAGVPQ